MREPEKKARSASVDTGAKARAKNQPTIAEAFKKAASPDAKAARARSKSQDQRRVGDATTAAAAGQDKWASLGQGRVLGMKDGGQLATRSSDDTGPAGKPPLTCGGCAAPGGAPPSAAAPAAAGTRSGRDDDDNDFGDEDELPCPVCTQPVALKLMNAHLDGCLASPPDGAAGADNEDAVAAASVKQPSSSGANLPAPLASAASTTPSSAIILVSDSDSDGDEHGGADGGSAATLGRRCSEQKVSAVRSTGDSDDDDLPAALHRPAKQPKTAA